MDMGCNSCFAIYNKMKEDPSVANISKANISKASIINAWEKIKRENNLNNQVFNDIVHIKKQLDSLNEHRVINGKSNSFSSEYDQIRGNFILINNEVINKITGSYTFTLDNTYKLSKNEFSVLVTG